MTPAQVLADVRNQCNESSANYWSDAEIYNYMSNAEQEVADLIGGIEKIDSSTTTVASTQNYDIPTDCQYITRLEWYAVPLKRIWQRDIDTMEFISYGNTTDTGNPHSYFEYNNDVYLYPVPDSAQTLKFWYRGMPTRLDDTSTAFETPAIFHPYYGDYCLFRMTYKDQEDALADRYQNLWRENLQKAYQKWNLRNNINAVREVRDVDYMINTDQGMV